MDEIHWMKKKKKCTKPKSNGPKQKITEWGHPTKIHQTDIQKKPLQDRNATIQNTKNDII